MPGFTRCTVSCELKVYLNKKITKKINTASRTNSISSTLYNYCLYKKLLTLLDMYITCKSHYHDVTATSYQTLTLIKNNSNINRNITNMCKIFTTSIKEGNKTFI